MKKRFGIFLAVIVLLLVLSVAVACDPQNNTNNNHHTYNSKAIAFVTNGGSEVESVIAEAGSDISELLPADPTKEGYVFGGWSLEDNGFASEVAELPTTMPEENVTYYARWTWHAVIVPRLQPLDDKDEPVTDRAQYAESRDYMWEVEVDPDHPSVDLSEDPHEIKGFTDVSTADEHKLTLSASGQEFKLDFRRASYNISFNLNNKSVTGRVPGVRKFFGQKLTLPDLADYAYSENNAVEVPNDLRFGGWMSKYDDDSVFEAYGKEIIVGEDDCIVDGTKSDVTLWAYYDEGYFDLSMGDDYVFIPKHEQGTAYVDRVGIEMKGTYTENPSRSETSPHLGIFTVDLESGTRLNGYLYEDGHFSYKQTMNPTYIGEQMPAYYYLPREVDEETVLTLVNDYGYATLTVGSPIPLRTIVDNEVVDTVLDVGTYVGGYWYDETMADWCFTYVDKANGDTFLDIHFNPARLRNDDGTYLDGYYFVVCGTELGLFCEGVSQSGVILGDMIFLDGYGTAVIMTDDSQYQGSYTYADDDTYYISAVNSAGEYIIMYVRVDNTVYGQNSAGLFVMTYEKGDPNLLIWACKNSDGEILSMDGFGNAYYTAADGTVISGEAGLVGELFETTTPPVAYTLTEKSGKVHYFIVDQGSVRLPEEGEEGDEYFYIGDFVHTEEEVTLNYLYNSSAAAGEYVGAIATVGDGSKEAYFLTAYTQSDGSVIFRELDEGKVTSDGKGGYVYASSDGGYIISYEEDEKLTTRYEVPTITTAQMQLSEMKFDVAGGDNGTKIGTLTINANGATYAADEGGFENKDYEYAYGSVIIRNSENSMTMFVLDSFGTSPKAFATTERTLYAGGTDEPQGMLYTFMYPYTDDEGKSAMVEEAMLWLYMYGELHFFAVAEITPLSSEEMAELGSYESSNKFAVPMSGAQVYIISSLLGGYYAIKQGEDYLAPNTELAYGEFPIEGEDGTTLQLDAYGAAKYTQGSKTFEGSYGAAEGTFKATFKGEGAPNDFKFLLSSNSAVKVQHREFFVINPATLSVISSLRIADGEGDDIIGRSADLYRASEDSNGNVTTSTNPIAKGTIERGDKDGIYKFSGTSNDVFKTTVEFTFRIDEIIFTQKVFVRNNVTMPTGEFTEDGIDPATSKKVTLDEWGRATYFNGKEILEGLYYNYGGMYRFVNFADDDIDLLFTVDRDLDRLLIYGAPAKPFMGGTYELTYNSNQYTLQMEVDGNIVKGTLKSGETIVAFDNELTRGEDDIFNFDAEDNERRHYTFDFIISEGKLVMYDSALDYTMVIYTGNYYLMQQGIGAVGGNATYSAVGLLEVKGFHEVAEVGIVSTDEIVKGSIQREGDSVIFKDEYGNKQTFKVITFAENDALFIEGSEKGPAIEYFYTMGSIGNVLAYFDGMGKAYKADETTGEQTEEELGYYFYGTNPFAVTDEDLFTCLIVGAFKDEKGESLFNPSHVYIPYSLGLTNDDGSSQSIVGVSEYKTQYNGVAVADDGTVFIFNGYDTAYYYDSLGLLHVGYFNNYGEMVDGVHDNRYLITDEYDNATLYYVYFDDREEGSYIKAKRASYVINDLFSNMYAEVQFTYTEDYEPAEDSYLPEMPEDAQGVAVVVAIIDGVQYAWQGYFTLEGGLMTIDIYDTEGKPAGTIELMLYANGTADWNNYQEWFDLGE